MAVTESVKIVFEVDDKALVSTVAQLQAVGKVSQEDAAKFNALTAASKAAGASLEGASKGAEKFAVASKDVAKSTTEVAKSAADLKTIAPTLASAGQAGEDAGDGFVSLTKQIKAAKDELQRVSEEFGESSVEAQAAAKSLAVLTKQSEDLQKQVTLLKPENKVAAFERLGTGIVGAFQAATGALQAFGIENEEAQKIAQKLQGALNLVGGIQSVLQLKSAFQDVKVVLGFTTAAQNTLTVATEAGAAATNTAAASTRGFAAALSSTGIGAIVVGLGLLAGAFILASDSTDKDTEAEEKNKDARDKNIDALNEEIDLLEAKRLAQDKGVGAANRELELAKARGAQGKELFDAEQKARQEELAALLRRQAFLGDDFKNEQERLALAEQIKDKRNEVVAAEIQFEREQREKSVENFKESEEKKLQIKLQAIDDEIALLEEAQRGALIGVDDEIQRIAITDSFREKITAKQIERAKVANESITLIEQKAANDQLQSFEDLFAAVEAQRDKDVADAEKAAADKLASEQKLLDGKKALLGQEEALALLQNAVTAVDAKDLAEKNFKTQEEFLKKRIALEKEGSIEQQKLQAQLALLYKEYEKEKTDETEKGEQERAELRQSQIEQGFEIANAATDLLIEANQRQYEEEIAALEESKEKGLITEEQYEARLKKLKQKAAEDNKKAQVFQATMSAAQAILSALTIVADPATKAAAVAFAATVGALNLAKVIATPIPKFKKGTLAVPGHDTGEDSVMAMLRPGEAVIPTEINREYAPIIRAIYRKEISSKEMNEFITSRDKSESSDTRKDLSIEDIKRFVSSYQSERNASIKELSIQDISEFINSRKNISYEEFSEVMRSKNSHLVTTKTIDVEPILKFDQVSLDALFKRDIKVSRINSTINNTSAAAMPSINVKADVDTYALSRAMAKNKSMELSNPDIVAKALAQELSKLDNPRRR